MRMVFLLLWLSVTNLAWAQDGWNVDGVWLGATLDQLSRPLEDDETTFGWSSWEGQILAVYIRESIELCRGLGVVSCSGRQLRFGSKVLVKFGDKVSRLTNLIGEPDRTSGALGCCYQDPFYWYHYRRGGILVSVFVSNDEFLRRWADKRLWPEMLGKVWCVRLSRADRKSVV